MSVNRPLPPTSIPGAANWGVDQNGNQKLEVYKVVNDPGVHGHPVYQFVSASWQPLLQINNRSGMLRLAAVAGRNLQSFTTPRFVVQVTIDGTQVLENTIYFPSENGQRDNGITIGGIIPADERLAFPPEIGGVSMGQIPWENQIEIFVWNWDYPDLEVSGFVNYHLTS